MKRSILIAVVALVGLLAMHGLTANHNPLLPHSVESSTHAGMGMPTGMAGSSDSGANGTTDHERHTMTELCFAILTALVGLLLLGIGLHRSSIRTLGQAGTPRLVRFAWARAGPLRPPSIAELCVSRT